VGARASADAGAGAGADADADVVWVAPEAPGSSASPGSPDGGSTRAAVGRSRGRPSRGTVAAVPVSTPTSAPTASKKRPLHPLAHPVAGSPSVGTDPAGSSEPRGAAIESGGYAFVHRPTTSMIGSVNE
jgi:hypothetical protein